VFLTNCLFWEDYGKIWRPDDWNEDLTWTGDQLRYRGRTLATIEPQAVASFPIRSKVRAAKRQSRARSRNASRASFVSVSSAHLVHLRANCRYSRDVVTAVTPPPTVQIIPIETGPIWSEVNTIPQFTRAPFNGEIIGRIH
jgi:hypothetical protein